MDLKTLFGVLGSLLVYSIALIKVNEYTARRRQKKAESDPEEDVQDEKEINELFPNGDRRKFRAAIARLEIQGEEKYRTLTRLEARAEESAKQIADIQSCVESLSEQLRALEKSRPRPGTRGSQP